MAEQGYRRIKIKVSQQVVDVPIPVAIARVEGGTAEYVEEPKPEAKSEQPKVETAAVTTGAERAMQDKPVNRMVTPVHQQPKQNRSVAR